MPAAEDKVNSSLVSMTERGVFCGWNVCIGVSDVLCESYVSSSLLYSSNTHVLSSNSQHNILGVDTVCAPNYVSYTVL